MGSRSCSLLCVCNGLFEPASSGKINKCPLDFMIDELKEYLASVVLNEDRKGRLVRIPVVYGGDFGPDLEKVAKYHRLTVEEVIALHSKKYIPFI